MAFRSIGSLELTNSAPLLKRYIIANSVTMTLNDSVKLVTGFVTAGTTAALVLGHVNSLGTNQGVGLSSSGVTGADFGTFVNSYETASNNQTVAFVKADVDISKFSLYTATLDAAIGTTTGSNLPGYHINIADATQLSESSATASSAQYTTHGVDTVNSALAVVSIYTSQLV